MKRLLIAVAKQLITLYCKTWRFRFHNCDNFFEQMASGCTHVVTVWHDQLLPLTFSWYGRQIGTIASQSKDGDIITQLLHMWGYRVARGSSTRGGARALIGAKKILEDGSDLAITVDGPKGPRHVVKTGAVYISKMAGVPVQTVYMKCKRFKRFKSWDKFILPLPFSLINVYCGGQLEFDEDMSETAVERDRLALENLMLEETRELTPDFV